MTPPYNFAPASPLDRIVFGAERPGYSCRLRPIPAAEVRPWGQYLREQGVRRVICLLSASQLALYDELLALEAELFGVHPERDPPER